MQSSATEDSKIYQQSVEIPQRDYVAVDVAWLSISLSPLSARIPDRDALRGGSRQGEFNNHPGFQTPSPEIGDAEGGWQFVQSDPFSLPPVFRNGAE